MAVARAALEADGVKVVTAPGYYDALVRAVGDLRAKGQRDPLTVEQHATCPRHVAWVEYDPETRSAAPVYGCSDYKASGHQRWTDPNTPAATANVLPEEERAERRQVRENNAAWRSAETVRREWLPTLAARRTPPKGAAEFIARAVAFHGALLQDAATKGHGLAAQMLGHKQSMGGGQYIAGMLDKASTPAPR
ncbi:hypothetical protein [Cellulomonas sp. C5510]|uniref:hypothetical protein n=1 Tax=Cellulomonas sp. C5510 TaxID=2871170 RepID=UPI001C93B8E3|nr:hypothetical protein [Cellulomonas sp. C5510]QZN85416.1 hypothetical protein K5O09_16895 [Cellulomonas sp. C5510]